MRHPLHVYRDLLRAAKSMPTASRKRFVEVRSRQGFEEGRKLKSLEDIAEHVALAEFQLDTVREQASHLSVLLRDGHLKNP
eukprot:jgi/Botrbrau1/9876/Bobra.0080s0011.1